jgi:hypothetical protein
LDEVRIFVGAAGNESGYNPTAKTLAGRSAVWDLDGAGDATVKLNYRLNAGSGAGDMFLLVPEAAFAGSSANGFVYLYSKFSGANAGFEEWAVRAAGSGAGTGGDTGQPASTASLSGSVYYDADYSGVRDAGDIGLAGVTIQLQGTDYLGQTVVLTTTTDSNGFFTFANLAPGTYSILRTSDPVYQTDDGQNLVDGLNNIGSLGGTAQETDGVSVDGIVDIVVGEGQNGTDYGFGLTAQQPY